MKNPQSFKVQARQGDVYLVKINDPSKVKRLEKIEKDAGRTVLAYGEVTGHAHAIESNAAELWALAGNMANSLLEVTKPVVLRHEEHDPIEIGVGMYEIVRQREYSPEAIKFVAD